MGRQARQERSSLECIEPQRRDVPQWNEWAAKDQAVVTHLVRVKQPPIYIATASSYPRSVRLWKQLAFPGIVPVDYCMPNPVKECVVDDGDVYVGAQSKWPRKFVRMHAETQLRTADRHNGSSGDAETRTDLVDERFVYVSVVRKDEGSAFNDAVGCNPRYSFLHECALERGDLLRHSGAGNAPWDHSSGFFRSVKTPFTGSATATGSTPRSGRGIRPARRRTTRGTAPRSPSRPRGAAGTRTA